MANSIKVIIPQKTYDQLLAADNAGPSSSLWTPFGTQTTKGYGIPMSILESLSFVNSGFDLIKDMPAVAKAWSAENNSFDNSSAWWVTFGRDTGYITSGAGDPASLTVAKSLAAAYTSTGATTATVGDTAGQLAQTLVPGLAGLESLLATLTSPSTWIRVGLFVVALTFLIIGFLIISHGQANQGAQP